MPSEAPATSVPPPPAPTPSAVAACPICSRSPMKERGPGKNAPRTRSCPSCRADFRERSPGRWTLEYLDPDWFHRPSSGPSRSRPALLQARSWEDWSTDVSSRPKTPPPLPAEPLPSELEPGEVVRQEFRPVRIVQPLTHQAWHADGVDGAAWVTNRALRIAVGDFRWAVPLSDLRSARNAAGMLEIIVGSTEEPLHLLLAEPERLLALLK